MASQWHPLLKKRVYGPSRQNKKDAKQDDAKLTLQIKKEVKEERVHSIIYGSLVTYWFNMKNFNYPTEKAKDIIKSFAEKYNIDTKTIYGIDINQNDILNDFTTVSHEDIIEKPESYGEKKK